MGTLENTISMMEKSRKDFLKAVDVAEKDITASRYKDAEGVFDELEQRYGF